MGVFRRGRLAAVGAVAGVGLMMVGSLPASAQNAGAGAFLGSGTISPGLGVTPQAVTFSLAGTLTGAGVLNGGPVVVSDSCTFSGSGAADDLATGMGSVSGSCSGNETITSSLTYTRVGAVVAVSGTATVGTASGGTAAAVCLFALTSLPGVSPATFQVVCAAGAAVA